jgi:hypothetical protein
MNSDDGRFRSSLHSGAKKWEERRRKSLDHIQFIVQLQEWDGEADDDDDQVEYDKPTVLLTTSCRMQIRAYVRRIASMYNDNRYHALEHAVHVTMSANKLLDMLHEDDRADDDAAVKTFFGERKNFTSSLGVVDRDFHRSFSTTSANSIATETFWGRRHLSIRFSNLASWGWESLG